MCELLAAPPVPIYYTTDGSTPTTASGVYEDPFPVPDGTITENPAADARPVKRDDFFSLVQEGEPRGDLSLLLHQGGV